MFNSNEDTPHQEVIQKHQEVRECRFIWKLSLVIIVPLRGIDIYFSFLYCVPLLFYLQVLYKYFWAMERFTNDIHILQTLGLPLA